MGPEVKPEEKTESDSKSEEPKKDEKSKNEELKSTSKKESSRKRKTGRPVRSGSPRRTRSSDFYTSMVEEAIRVSKLEAEGKLKKPPKKESDSEEEIIPKKDRAKFEQKKEAKKEIKKPAKKLKQSKKLETESESSERSFGELRSILRNSTTADLAKKLIGVNLCRRIDGKKIIGRIVETEAFLGSIDKCSLTYKKKKSKALKSYFDDAGVACVEILEKGTMQVAVSSALPGEYVLIKALQPMLGRDKMKALRGFTKSAGDMNLAKGPHELTQALKITLEFDNLDLLEGGGDLWIEAGSTCPKIVRSRRVLDMNNEKNWQQWSFKKLRYYDQRSSCISMRDQKESQNLVNQSEIEEVDDS